MSGNDTIDKIQNYNIELHNISFGYENRPIIQNVTLKIPEHRVTAIVGPSGSGKTTLCKFDYKILGCAARRNYDWWQKYQRNRV